MDVPIVRADENEPISGGHRKKRYFSTSGRRGARTAGRGGGQEEVLERLASNTQGGL
jgi:hypothetical protein